MGFKQWLTGWAVGCLVTGSVSALELGDVAPPLQISEWVKGQPVNLAKTDSANIVIIEFWATWCGPCKKNIPHLTEMQAKFGDQGVVVIGLSSEDSETVKEFVEEQGDKMAYTIAVDDDSKTDDAYLRGLGVYGIPHAVIVQDNKVAWSGHPKYMDNFVQLMMAGTYDHRALKLIPRYFEKVKSSGLDDEAKAMGEIIYQSGKVDAYTMNSFAWAVLTKKIIADEHRDLQLAHKVAKAAYDVSEGQVSSIIDTYAMATFKNGNVRDAVVLQQQAVDVEPDDDIKATLSAILKKYQLAAQELTN